MYIKVKILQLMIILTVTFLLNICSLVCSFSIYLNEDNPWGKGGLEGFSKFWNSIGMYFKGR